MSPPINKNINNYGPNYKDSQLKREKLKLQNFKDLLTGEKLDFENVHYHHIDYDKNNDNPDNHILISMSSHMKITQSQIRNPIEAEWYKRQLRENLTALKEGRNPKIQRIKKISNFNEYIVQLLWDDKKPTISSRIEIDLYESIKHNNISQLIQNFIRKFLRNHKFRQEFLAILYQQFDQDFSEPLLTEKWFEDTKIASCRLLTIEKELINLYFKFLCNFTISYAIRVGLIHFRDLEYQKPIEKKEVIPILKGILNINKNEVKQNAR